MEEQPSARLQVTTVAVTRGCSVTAGLTDNTTQVSNKLQSHFSVSLHTPCVKVSRFMFRLFTRPHVQPQIMSCMR